jgi:hypothetical protein
MVRSHSETDHFRTGATLLVVELSRDGHRCLLKFRVVAMMKKTRVLSRPARNSAMTNTKIPFHPRVRRSWCRAWSPPGCNFLARLSTNNLEDDWFYLLNFDTSNVPLLLTSWHLLVACLICLTATWVPRYSASRTSPN